VRVGVGVITRTTICAVGPMLPTTSRTCTVNNESPGGKAAVRETSSQNCAVELGLASCSKPLVLSVHGDPG
jgi:hypothetical protein